MHTSLNKINALIDIEVKLFFFFQQTHRFHVNYLYNVDETVIINVQQNSKILASKGQKQVRTANNT